MSRWLYLAVGCLAGVVIAVVVVVVVVPGGGDSPQGTSSSSGPGEGGDAVREPPEIAEVKAVVVAFRQALQRAGGNPCELMTPEGRVGLYTFYSGSPPEEATDECAATALETTVPRYMGQREIPADTETFVVVRGSQAVALERGGVLPLFLTNTGGRWLIADDDELSDAQALVEALERGEGQ